MEPASYNQSSANMKRLLTLLPVFGLGLTHAQKTDFEQSVQFIQNKIYCCSVPFSNSSKKKVDSITIDKKGNIALSYSDKSPKQHFNLFELYKDENATAGIDTILNGKFIQFNVNENKARLIRFATVKDASDVYNVLLQLILSRDPADTFSDSLFFLQAVDDINTRLAQWAERGNRVRVSALKDGSVDIVNKFDQHLKFNLFELDSDPADTMNGIVIDPCNPASHAPLTWVNFLKAGETVAFIRLKCNTPKTELTLIRSAFLRLRLLCIKTSSLSDRPPGAAYFIPRNSLLNSGNKMLAESIRSIDIAGDSRVPVPVNSSGEGWLDKDSLPIGQWYFYAKNSTGKEYLFKTGLYQITTPEMFEVTDIDSVELANFHLSFLSLQKQQAQAIPFVKVKAWKYYHPDGTIWKKVNFKHRQIPVNTSIVIMDLENTEQTRLVINLKERLDEWEG